MAKAALAAETKQSVPDLAVLEREQAGDEQRLETVQAELEIIFKEVSPYRVVGGPSTISRAEALRLQAREPNRHL